MEIGIVAKPNTGKSSFFSAATLIDVPIADYPFTTIKPNIGMTYTRRPCPCKELKIKCSPKNSKCVNGTRLIPIKVTDVAGLVPDAHLGKGLGNKFLDDLRQADALIHVVDISGTTDSEGKQGAGDPIEDVKSLEREIDLWLFGIVKKQIEKTRDISKLAEGLSGLGFKEAHIKKAGFSLDLSFASRLRQIGKPIIIAANKCDLPNTEENLGKVKSAYPEEKIIPCSAQSELALRKAERAGLIEYNPGERNFKIKGNLEPRQAEALEFIKKQVLERFGNTGVQQLIDSAVELLNLIVVYPVEDENKFSDKHGNVLPDAILIPRGSTPPDLAFKIHTDLGKGFIAAIDARKKTKLAKDHVLEDGQIVKIVYK